ncbi:5'-nucleotidase C-terminal domain-containing protein [Aeromicrobium sp. CnD17-E]|uniref:5'-nucleotidase C-terminal domain-containing protein n=1 Tax=Aeromicrobium sp. CnD17-E TaxID=2954487 RepID=UPI0020973280|nr:5'-nucleotidase C-terminal domain-containing protein [Aeromicrobium sp. CnD17-E]MCO7237968.1 5'-nucleotidase C-terminal domain-containing protein [Aeromicrobium sp. CnD17-E]
MKTRLRRAALAPSLVLALGAGVLAATPAQAADDVTIRLLDVNDFHGRIDANTVKVAGTIEQLRAEAGEANTLFLSAGDNIGASLFASSVQQDEPTIDVLNALGLRVSTIGNHELDRGFADLAGRVSDRADFTYLGANVVSKATGEPALPAYETFEVGGLDVAVVGAVTEETPSLVSPAGIADLEFTDPVEAVNRTVDELEASPTPPDVVVAAYHEGAGAGTPDGATLEQEVAAGGAFADIVTKTDPQVDAIFTGHTHKQYAWQAPVPGEAGRTRPVLQTGSYGEAIGSIDLTVDGDTGAVTSTATNVKRTTTDDATLVSRFPRVAQVKTIVDAALAKAKQVGEQPVAQVSADITTAYAGGNRDDRASESTLGNLVADAQLAGVEDTPAGADLAVVNPGGLRNELLFKGTGGTNADGVVTFAEANAVLPFTNNLSSVSLTGAQLKKVFEQQWQRDAAGAVPSRPYLQLGTSSNVAYTFDPTRAEGDRITSLRVDGKAVDPAATYKVAVPSFLASGGDNFRAFAEGTSVDTGLLDYEVWIDHLKAESPVAPDFARHAVQVEGLQQDYTEGDALAVTLPKLDLTSLGSPANTSVAVALVSGGTRRDLGEVPVSGGVARLTQTLPKGVTGTAHLEVKASPSGTTAVLPSFTIAKALVDARLDVVTLPFVKQGSFSLLVARVRGAEGRPTGTVSVTAGETRLGSARLSRGAAVLLLDTRRLAVGRQVLTTAYSGDATYKPAQRDTTVTVLAKRGR